MKQNPKRNLTHQLISEYEEMNKHFEKEGLAFRIAVPELKKPNPPTTRLPKTNKHQKKNNTTIHLPFLTKYYNLKTINKTLSIYLLIKLQILQSI